MIRMGAALVVALLFAAGPAGAEEYGRFDKVEAMGQFRVVVREGPAQSVRLEGADVGKVRVVVRRGELRIEQIEDRDEHDDMLDLTAYVSAPDLVSIEAYRGAELDAGVVRADSLRLDVSTGAELTISGACSSLAARATLGGILYAEQLHCQSASIRASYGGEAKVQAAQSVAVSASMGAEVDVAGSPNQQALRTSWGAEVEVR